MLSFYPLAWSANEQLAKIQGVLVQADSMVRDSDQQTVDLEGHVQVIYQNQHISCDSARINLRAKTIDAKGHAIATTPTATIAGSRILLDYESNTGLILDGYVQSGPVLFEGSQIQKLNDTEYITEDARYTTCTTCPETWSFSGSRIRAQLGGYAYIQNSVMRITNIPVFWMPYMIVPLKSDRQSGLLTPGIESSSSGGVAISESFFWAMSRSQDSTWTFKNYQNRGQKGLLNYRYVLNNNSKGELNYSFLRDKAFAKVDRLNNFRPNAAQGDALDRWFLQYRHYYELPDGFIHRAYLNNASDLQYPQDFPFETGIYRESAMENRTSITKNTDSMHMSVQVDYYKNMMQSNPLADNENAVHRLPEIRLSQIDTHIGNSDFLYSYDLDYVNFARSGLAYDNLNSGLDITPNKKNDRFVQGTGSSPSCSAKDWEKDPQCHKADDATFDDGIDLIRTGQRFDFQPTIYRPFKFQNLELMPKISYRELKYTFPTGPISHDDRRYIETDLSARTSFSKIYGDFSSLQSERIKHEIQPEISFTTIPWMENPHSTFFGRTRDKETPLFTQDSITDADLNGTAGLQYDYYDRVYDKKFITFAFTNKLTRKVWADGAPTYQQFVTWKISQSYDVYVAEKNPYGQPLSDLLSDLNINLDYVDINQTAHFFPYQRVTNTSSRIRLKARNGDYLQLMHNLDYKVTPGQEVDISNRNEDYIYSIKKGFNWLDLIGRFNMKRKVDDSKFYLNYWGYGVRLRVPGNCLQLAFTNYKISSGDTNFAISANFIWDGVQKPFDMESLLEML